MDMRSTITPNPIAPPDSSVDAKLAPSLRAFDRQMISDAIEAVNTDFDLERLREIDRFLRNLPDSEATLDDVAQMLDAITAWELGGRYREALPIATKALRRARELNDPMLLHKALNARARVADGAMDNGTSIGCLMESLTVAEKLNDVRTLVVTFMNLGTACGRIGLNAIGWKCCEKARGILERRQVELSNERLSYLRCVTLCWTADLQVQLGNCSAAVTAAQLSREVGKGALLGLPAAVKAQALDLMSLSRLIELRALLRLGLHDEACNLAAEVAESLRRGELSVRTTWNARLVLAEYTAAQGNHADAIAELQQVVASPAVATSRTEAMLALAQCYESSGLPAAALRELQELQMNIEAARREVGLEELRRIDGIDPIEDDEFDQSTRRRIADYRVAIEGIGTRLSRKLNYLTELAVSAEIREGNGRDDVEHIYRVGALCSLLAAEAGCERDLCWLAEIAGRLHDIGKSSISDIIALKAQPLTDAEWTIVRGHCSYGALLVADVGEARLVQVVAAVRHHHERFSGGGYPNNLRGDDIPLLARIVALSESFDAMLQSRTYRPSRSVEIALQEIERCAGSQFDPQLAGLFVQMIRRLQREVGDLNPYLAEQGQSSSAVQVFTRLTRLFAVH